MLAQDCFNTLNKNGITTKTRIAFVGTKTLNEIGKRVATKFNSSIELTFIDSTFDDATAQVKALIKQYNIHGVVSSGGNEFCLSNAIPHIPVTHIPIDGFDLMSALAQAANIADKIALLSYGNRIATLLQPIGSLLNRPLILSGFQDVISARNEINRMKNDGCAIVGSSLIVDLAREAGIMAHHYYSEKNVATALQSALLQAAQNDSNIRHFNDSTAMLESFVEPALLLDHAGQLLTFNKSARKLWDELYGINLDEKTTQQLSSFGHVAREKSKNFSSFDRLQIGENNLELTTIPFRLDDGECCSLILQKPLFQGNQNPLLPDLQNMKSLTFWGIQVRQNVYKRYLYAMRKQKLPF